jgi:hypothetical protein
MKRGFSRSLGTALATLCFLFFGSCPQSAFADEAPKTARLVYVDNGSWKSDAIASNASAGATLRITNCKGIGFPGDTLTFDANGQAAVRNFTKLQCNTASLFGTVDLPYTGSIELGTEATYRDANGNFDFVYIPALTDAQTLPAGSKDRLTVHRIMSAADRSTFLAIVGSSWLTLKFYDGANPFIVGFTDAIKVDGSRWYDVATSLPIGRVEITRGVTGFGFPASDDGTDVNVVGFVGKREGGSPRVELPTRSAP